MPLDDVSYANAHKKAGQGKGKGGGKKGKKRGNGRNKTVQPQGVAVTKMLKHGTVIGVRFSQPYMLDKLQRGNALLEYCPYDVASMC
jgi:hypothetical protein